MDPAVQLLSVACFTVVSGRSNYHDTCQHKLLYLEADRIVSVSVDRVSTEAQVDNPNVIGRLVLQDPIQAVQQPGGLATSLVIENLDADQIRSRRNALIGTAAQRRTATSSQRFQPPGQVASG